MKCDYLKREAAVTVYQSYDEVLRMLVTMINHPDVWTITKK